MQFTTKLRSNIKFRSCKCNFKDTVNVISCIEFQVSSVAITLLLSVCAQSQFGVGDRNESTEDEVTNLNDQLSEMPKLRLCAVSSRCLSRCYTSKVNDNGL